MSRFLVCFSKTIYKVKNYRSGKNQIIRSKLKGGIFYLKILLFENSEVVKSLPSRERKLKKCKSVSKHRCPDYGWQIWLIHSDVSWKLRAYEKNRKYLFVDLSLILQLSTLQIVLNIYTGSYGIFTMRHFRNFKIYLLPDDISKLP